MIFFLALWIAALPVSGVGASWVIACSLTDVVIYKVGAVLPAFHSDGCCVFIEERRLPGWFIFNISAVSLFCMRVAQS